MFIVFTSMGTCADGLHRVGVEQHALLSGILRRFRPMGSMVPISLLAAIMEIEDGIGPEGGLHRPPDRTRPWASTGR